MTSDLNACGVEMLYELGSGSFGTVRLGRCTQSNGHHALVAVKAIERKVPDEMPTREIETMRMLSGTSSNIVSLLYDVVTPTHVFLVLEYCNGGDLSAYLQASGPLGETVIQNIFAQLAEAMKAMRSRSISHLDLKPGNILLSRADPLEQNAAGYTELIVKVADFGQSRVLKDGEVATGSRGTPLYMAPEVLLGEEYCAKADLWSIGAVAAQCITGCVPYNDGPVHSLEEIFRRHKKHYCETGEHTLPRPRLLKACSPSPHLHDFVDGLLRLVVEERVGFDSFFTHPFLSAHLEELHDAQEHRMQAATSVANASVLGSHDESVEWRNFGGMSSLFGREGSLAVENSVAVTGSAGAIGAEAVSVVEEWLNAALKQWTEPRPLGSCRIDGLEVGAGRVSIRREH